MAIIPFHKAKVKPGDNFDRLTVIGMPFTIRHLPSGNCESFVMAECKCGNVVLIRQASLLHHVTRSCGCFRVEAKTTHGTFSGGHRRNRLFDCWFNMKQRCYNTKHPAYHHYGGRGIVVCADWIDSFVAFRDWALQNGYHADLTLDRERVNDSYEPDNCRWVTRKVQSRNTRQNHHIAAFGETKILCEWAEDERCVVTRNVLRHRIEAGWRPEDAIAAPKHTRRRSL